MLIFSARDDKTLINFQGGSHAKEHRSFRPYRSVVGRARRTSNRAGIEGEVNEHNGWVPRDFWPEEWEKQAIVGLHLKNPLEGYRRLTFMMLDAVTLLLVLVRTI